MDTLLVLIPAFPLAGALIVAAFGRWLGARSHLPIVLGVALSFLCSLLLLFNMRADKSRNDRLVPLWTWAAVADAYEPAYPLAANQPADTSELTPIRSTGPFHFDIDVVLRADTLTCIMLSMVTFVSTLVAIYAAGYMHGDPGYWRFFAYIGLFVFSMTMLVSVSNFVLLYVFWEAVGVCSYLLIGFWYQKPEAAAAGKKAFLVNRVGDFGFALALFLIWSTYGTLNFHDTVAPTADGATAITAGIFGPTRIADPTLYEGGGTALAICLLLMLGACGKSAQFPLHVWLPDAMEGPTPVSALIHAATMVTAGVYMVTRCAIVRSGFGRAAIHNRWSGNRRRKRGFNHWRLYGVTCRADRNHANRSQARIGLLDDQPTGIHVLGRGHHHASWSDSRDVPPLHARVF